MTKFVNQIWKGALRWARLRSLSNSASYKQWWNEAGSTDAGARAVTYEADAEEDYRVRGWQGDPNSYGARHFIDRAGLGPQSRVLEIGCGMARIGRELAPHVKEWHGADISGEMLAHASRRTVGLDNVYLHELSDGTLSAFRDGEFDFVYATTVFMHLDKEDLYQYLKESHRVLRADGIAFFDTWNLLHPDTYRQWEQSQARNRGQDKIRGRIQFCTPVEFKRYLDEVGFEIMQFDEDKLIRVFCRRRPLALHEPDDGFAPFGYVDSPRNGETVGSTLRVWGWALDDVETVTVRLDGSVELGTANYGTPREDVAPLFPRYPTAGSCGYVLEADLSGVSRGEHTLQVIARDRRGAEANLSGNHLGIVVE